MVGYYRLDVVSSLVDCKGKPGVMMLESGELIVACDGGGTGVRAGLYDQTGRLLRESHAGPANPVEYGIEATLASLQEAIGAFDGERVGLVAAGVSGASRAALRETLAEGLAETAHRGVGWVLVMGDLQPVLAANAGEGAGLLAIAGTGSSVMGCDAAGRWRMAGGRGRVFGDAGSGYALGVAALQAAADAVDGMGPETGLVEALCVEAGAAAFDALTGWAAEASKKALAGLAEAVIACAAGGDGVAGRVVAEQAALLARQVDAAAAGLGLGVDVPVWMLGSLFDAPLYRTAFEDALGGRRAARPVLGGHRAVLEVVLRGGALPEWVSERSGGVCTGRAVPATEQRHGAGLPLDRLGPEGIAARMAEEDARAQRAAAAESGRIAACIRLAADAIGGGGRLVYVGAGTSGRLGVLDASECPPTFGVAPGRVIGIMAGGDGALRVSVEGAEDDAEAGALDLAAQAPGLSGRDFVVGIAASGTTPYVLGALADARAQGARTALICCNRGVAGTGVAEVVVAMDTGPEVVAGSTRLKAGTATKMALNMISTGAFALSGYVYEGYMVGVQATNVKLRKRAAGMVAVLTGRGAEESRGLLEAAGGSVSVAVVMGLRGLNREDAARLLELRGGLRGALEEE